MFVTKHLSISAGINDRGNNDVNPPWFGFCYGSWLPRFSYNGGRRGQVRDFGWRWLCFHGSITYWPKR